MHAWRSDIGECRLTKRDSKTAAGAICRLERQAAAIDLDCPFGNRQAETGSAVFAGACLIDAIEAIEDARLEIARNSWARVGHIDDRPFRRLRDSDLNLSADRRVLDGIVDQIQQRLS